MGDKPLSAFNLFTKSASDIKKIFAYILPSDSKVTQEKQTRIWSARDVKVYVNLFRSHPRYENCRYNLARSCLYSLSQWERIPSCRCFSGYSRFGSPGSHNRREDLPGAPANSLGNTSTPLRVRPCVCPPRGAIVLFVALVSWRFRELTLFDSRIMLLSTSRSFLRFRSSVRRKIPCVTMNCVESQQQTEQTRSIQGVREITDNVITATDSASILNSTNKM